ncbi:PatA/PatG family cyanobactin maturation protease [Spirillospora sp. NPDC052269]
MRRLWELTRGDAQVRVAVLDGPVDLSHPAFAGTSLRPLLGVWAEEGFDGPVGRHGTHVASVIFGRHDGPVKGICPGCDGLSLAPFTDMRRKTSQLEIARAIELAVEAGAQVINISGGQLSLSGQAGDLLDRAVRLCRERNVLVVAAAGNDGCFCDHVPAALPSVLAVGALGDSGEPLAMSNWGPACADHGILTFGENILGALPGGATVTATGTSMAAPIVTGVAALLLSLQIQAGQQPDPLGVGAALLASAEPCALPEPDACKRYLAGKLDIGRAMDALQLSSGQATDAPVEAAETSADTVTLSCGTTDAVAPSHADGAMTLSCGDTESRPEESVTQSCGCSGDTPASGATHATTPASSQGVGLSGLIGGARHIYALGTLGYDFGTEARRDSFKQLMSPTAEDGTVIPANPYDGRQMAAHLSANPSEARSLIWTLNLELTPIYAIEATGPYASEVYQLLSRLLTGEVAAETDEDYIERVSIPGRLTGRSVRLFSGQIVPVAETDQIRGLFGWRINTLIDAATQAAARESGDRSNDELSESLREFLTRVYYDLRNLGATSADRALNFAATNAFQAVHTFATAIAAGMALDTINVEKSPFCRMDSDCWDVKLRFFDPENSRRARKVFRFTIDVSDVLPVTLGVVRTWSEAG